MGQMLRQSQGDAGVNFRIAGGTIYAGAKIYASRVDAVHSEIYRLDPRSYYLAINCIKNISDKFSVAMYTSVILNQLIV